MKKTILLLLLYLVLDKAMAQKQILFNEDSAFVYYEYAPLYSSDSPTKASWGFPDALPDGTWVILYGIDSTTVRMSGHYKHNTKHGEFASFNHEGQVLYKTFYNHGIKQKTTSYNEEGGNIRESYYDDDAIKKSVSWYPTEQISRIFEDNKITEWYPNAQLKTKKEFLDMQLHGEIILWYTNGNIKYKGLWNQGVEKESYYAKRSNKPLKKTKFRKLPKDLQREISKNW